VGSGRTLDMNRYQASVLTSNRVASSGSVTCPTNISEQIVIQVNCDKSSDSPCPDEENSAICNTLSLVRDCSLRFPLQYLNEPITCCIRASDTNGPGRPVGHDSQSITGPLINRCLTIVGFLISPNLGVLSGEDNGVVTVPPPMWW
jgi:hypothetical protein